MDKEKTGKQNQEKKKKLANMLGIACIIVALVLCDERFVLSAKAAPATLRSSDATVYEQTNEESNAIGNLVEGSSFEYIGDVTAEDGSVWHQITTSNGATGYIRGDREMEIGEEEPAPEEGGEEPVPEGEPAPEEGNDPGDQNLPEEGGGEPTPEESEPEADTEEDRNEDEDGDNPEEGEELEEDGLTSEVSRVENHRAKSYALDISGRIKGKEDIVPAMKMDTEGERLKTGKKIDITALLSILMILGCAGVMYLCTKRIKRLRTGTEEKRSAGINENKLRKKADKRKRGQKRKNKKK